MDNPYETQEGLTALSKRFDDAQATLAAPDVDPVGSDNWRVAMIRKQTALKIMLLDERLSRLDRERLESTYDVQQRTLDELDHQQQRNWQMEQRAKEIDLDTKYRAMTFEYADRANTLAEAQLRLGRQTRQSSEDLGKSLGRATWVLAAATIVLAAATIVLIVVTA